MRVLEAFETGVKVYDLPIVRYRYKWQFFGKTIGKVGNRPSHLNAEYSISSANSLQKHGKVGNFGKRASAANFAKKLVSSR